MTTATITRGSYDEINMSSLDAKTASAVRNLVNAAGSAAKIDEHGSWDFGTAFDRKGRGQALNWDLYGVGNDVHAGTLLIVIQVRQFERRYKNGYGNVRKNYFLVGTNEDGSAFAHPVSAHVVRTAIRLERDVVKACQDWIFGGDYARMIRHGDLALVPLSKRPAAEIVATERMVLEDSHEVTATQFRQNGHLYVQNPTLVHLPGTHPTVSGEGWYRVVVGSRADFWRFAAPTKD